MDLDNEELEATRNLKRKIINKIDSLEELPSNPVRDIVVEVLRELIEEEENE